MILAIVGSTLFADDYKASDWATGLIMAFLDKGNVSRVVSGGAIGIDTLAKNLAQDRGIEVIEFLPQYRRWAPNGFKDRNLKIAETCNELLRIAHFRSTTYGSGWTADRAEEMGKTVYRFTYSE